jgi:hypothetical protein
MRRRTDPEWNATLRENMRENFDGMRAYHQSEIAHTNHAIAMLVAIAGGVGAVTIALLLPNHPLHHVRTIAWEVFGAVSALALTVALTAHIKIEGDISSYRTIGAEYVRSAMALGLYDELEQGAGQASAIKQVTTIGQGRGYYRTLAIVWSFAAILVLAALGFAITVPSLSTL